MRTTISPSIALGALLILALTACSESPTPDTRRLVLLTQPVANGDDALIFAGDVRAQTEVNLSFRVAGKVLNRTVDAGDRVHAGQMLARLDDADLSLQSQAAASSVSALRADRDLATAELKRYSDLVAQKLVSQSLFESKKAQAQAAQSRYQQALAQSQVNANQTGYAVIRAPGPGVISQRMVEAGQVVNAGQPVFTFAADGARDVAISIGEQHIGKVQIGQPVAIELWTDGSQRFTGKVREIAGSADSLTRTFAARVAFDDAATVTQLGQSARVLLSGKTAGLMYVPLSALTETDNQPAVWLVGKDGRLRKRAVTVARYGAQHAEISNGVSVNEWIVQAGVHLLREGEQVRGVDANNRPVTMASGAKTP